MDTPLPRSTDDAVRGALKKRLDSEIARGLAELEAGRGTVIDDALEALWAELRDPGENGTRDAGVPRVRR